MINITQTNSVCTPRCIVDDVHLPLGGHGSRKQKTSTQRNQKKLSQSAPSFQSIFLESGSHADSVSPYSDSTVSRNFFRNFRTCPFSIQGIRIDISRIIQLNF